MFEITSFIETIGCIGIFRNSISKGKRSTQKMEAMAVAKFSDFVKKSITLNEQIQSKNRLQKELYYLN